MFWFGFLVKWLTGIHTQELCAYREFAGGRRSQLYVELITFLQSMRIEMAALLANEIMRMCNQPAVIQ